jgi:diphthine synthase
MLYVIGLGLGDAEDITVKGLEIVKRCDYIYLESYTSILTCGQEELVNIFLIRNKKFIKIQFNF